MIGLAEIKNFKQDEDTILRFLTLSLALDKSNDKIMGPWRRVLGGKKDVAFKIYIILLKSKKGEFTDDISQELGEPIHNIRRSLNDLEKIGLIEKLKRKKNRVFSDFWRIKQRVEGLLRIIPNKELTKGSKGEEKFWFEKYEEIAKLLVNYTGYLWLLKKNVSWAIEKNGIMNYSEERKYLKLSETTPPFNYITLFSKKDDYNLQILDQNNNPFEVTTEIYEHSNKKLNIVNALVPHDTIRNEFQKINIGEHYIVKIKDKKRLYACPKSGRAYKACFLYQINLDNTDSLELNYKIHENICPINCEIFFDNHKEFEINLTTSNSQQQEIIEWEVKNSKNYLNFYWKGKFLLKKAHSLKFLFEFEPKFESDPKEWIKMYEAVDCPFCQKIPFETIGRV